MPVLADDDVVVHGNAERGGDLDDRLRHPDIRLGGCRIAGGGYQIGDEIEPGSIGLAALRILVDLLRGSQDGSRVQMCSPLRRENPENDSDETGTGNGQRGHRRVELDGPGKHICDDPRPEVAQRQTE